MRLSKMLARAVKPKRRATRGVVAVARDKRYSTPGVVVNPRRGKLKTVRSKRVLKVRAWQVAAAEKFGHRGRGEKRLDGMTGWKSAARILICEAMDLN